MNANNKITITDIKAREIFDSRGNPTVEVELYLSDGSKHRAAVPSGASTGIYEALELRDKDKSRFLGKGVLKACKNITDVILPNLKGKEVAYQQEALDKLMVEELDGTKNEYGWSKSKLGANAILAVSLAVCRAGAHVVNLPLYAYISKIAGNNYSFNESNNIKFRMPVPSFNVINGGSHAGNSLAVQEFMILPVGASSFSEAMRIGAEVYQNLKLNIKAKYGINQINVGDEGGFAPDFKSTEEALDVLCEAIDKSGYKDKIVLGMDVAASEFYEEDSKSYNLTFKDKKKTLVKGDELINTYVKWAEKYNIQSIEDPFDQTDFDNYAKLTSKLKNKAQIVGDDLLVTNITRIDMALKKEACNALLLKVNQIGSVTESIEAWKKSKNANWGVMISHRSGETEDNFIADLVVGLGTGQIKTGAPARSERLAKYNQLLRIEEELGNNCFYAGKEYTKPYN